MITIQDFRSYTTRELLKLLFCEFWLFIIAFGLGFLISSDERFYVIYSNNNLGNSFVVYLLSIGLFNALLVSLCLTAVGLYKKQMNMYLQEQYLRILGGLLIALFVTNNAAYWFEHLDVGKYVWLMSIFLTYIFLVISRAILYVVSKNNALKIRTVVLGAGSKALQLKNDIEDYSSSGSNIVGYIFKPGERERLPRERIVNVSILSKSSENPILEYCLSNNIDTIVVAVDDRRNNFPLSELLGCKQTGISVIELMEFYEQELGREQLDLLDPSWVIYSNKLHSSKQYELNKRAFDCLLSSLLLFLLTPVAIIISFLIKATAGISVSTIDSTTKSGQFGIDYYQYSFNCYNRNGKKTWLGRLLQRVGLNNIPALYNILKGNLSFIGPQAISESYTEKFKEHVWYYKQRNVVKPGIVSWGYTRFEHDKLDMDDINIDLIKHYLQFDLFYVKKRTFLFDILILLNRIFRSDALSKEVQHLNFSDNKLLY